ncbi:uncharacterized protein LOC102716962 [Oryza brachyantha]|uniref:Uncharacterized protein n=1 Tax=Oryza brachyantha TaxID=4533 RepID=J3M2L4_ORYBR|nr:uncharacterized protein LOC102716962 [Oryza brachyantha]
MLPRPASPSGDVVRTAKRRLRRTVGRSTEKKNPQNMEFERRVAALEYRQEEQRKRAYNNLRLYLTMSPVSSHFVENGDDQVLTNSTSLLDGLEASASSSLIVVHFVPEESLRRCLINSSRALLEDSQKSDKAPDDDFSVNTFSNASVDVKRTTRKKGKKKNKRHKRGHGKKVSESSDIQSTQSKGASHCIDVATGESLTLPSNHVADKLFGDLSSDSSVREVSAERPDSETGNDGSSVTSIPSTSCTDERESSREACYFECCEQSSSNNSRCLDTASTSTLTDSSLDGHCTDSSWNFSDDTENLLIDKNECPCIQSKPTDFRGFKCGGHEGWLNKSNHDKNSCFRNSTGGCDGTQEMQLCSNSGSDGDFLPVMSRKRARKNRKMHLFGSCNVEHICGVEHGQSGSHSNCSSIPSNVCTQVASKGSTKDFIHPIKARTWTPHVVTLNDYMIGANMNHLLDPKQNRRGKPQKYSLSEVANNGFIEEKDACTAKMLPGIMRSTETNVGQMASSSTSDVIVQEITEETCSPIGPPFQKGGLHVLLRDDNVAVGTDSHDALNHVSSVDLKEQKKVDNAVSSKPHGMEGDLQAQEASSEFPECTTDYLEISSPTDGRSEVDCHSISAFEGHCTLNQERFVSSKLQSGEIIKAANDACKVQVASDVHLISGHPLADFEIFLYYATPVIAKTSCMKSGNYSQDQIVGSSTCQYQISNVSLRNVWEWYEEPGSYGLEVEIHQSLSPTKPSCGVSEFCAYFLPSLSAIQLFEPPKNNLHHKFDSDGEDLLLSPPNSLCLPKPSLSVQDHGELVFEYFESEHPSSRPPLFEKIKQLISGENLSTYQIFGDPKMLENLKLCDLHPASWFCVAWYPICRIPRGSCRAAFLTYHSLSEVVPRIRSPYKAHVPTHLVSPVVGFLSYNDKGEHWLQLRDPEIKPMSLDDATKINRAEVLKERLKTLRHGASVMSTMVIPKANGEESMNRHPDYEFFLSRSN